jgi:hypothetical protein
MGYSGRYHAASLAAVFIALAIGILIGIGLADDVVSGASQALEKTLRGDLEEAQSEVGDLETELGREREFGDTVYPALSADRLAGSSVALIGLGDLPNDTAKDVEGALEGTGASLDAVAVVALPPDPKALADAAGPRFSGARRGGEELDRLGRALGSGVVGDSQLLERARGDLFARFSGSLEGVDRVVLVSDPPDDPDAEQEAAIDDLTSGFYAGLRRSAAGVAGVERTDTDPTTLTPISEAGIATIDHVDLTAGKVALVFSLLGADGDYGVKEGADSFLPELIRPGRPQR